MSQYVTKIKTLEGDLQIDYNALANLPDLKNMFSNPNLLINSDFRNPVNQRGNTSYTYSGADVSYTIDRWCMNFNSVTTVNSGYVTLTGNTANNNYWYQTLEYPLSGTFTLSVSVKSVSGGSGVMYAYATDDNGTTQRVGLSQGIKTLTFNMTDLKKVGFCALKTGVTANIEWVKLEYGSIATPFAPRSYQDELLICRRYYRKYWTSMLFPQFYSNQYCGFLFDMPMRANPTVKTFSILSTSNGSSIGASVEVYAQGVYKFFVTQGYSEKAIIVPMLELDAEIY